MYRESWSKSEKQAARRAYSLAYARECEAIAVEIRQRVADLRGEDEIWALHDYLTETRREVDEKYDYRYSQLILVFARLVAEGWLSLDELEGLAEEKIERIGGIVSWARERDDE